MLAPEISKKDMLSLLKIKSQNVVDSFCERMVSCENIFKYLILALVKDLRKDYYLSKSVFLIEKFLILVMDTY